MHPVRGRTYVFALLALALLVAGVGCSSSSTTDRSPAPTAPTAPIAASPSPALADGEFALPAGPTITDVTLTDAPSYLFLFTHTEDQFNHELSEERYWRIGEMIEGIAAAYPSLDITWTIEFQGADAETIRDRNPETGLVDYLISLRDAGLVEFGYHAHHDPTYMNRPQNDLAADPAYEDAFDALWTWITCRKDPSRGGCIEERGGGLEMILDTFGQVKIVTGLGVGEGFQVERTAGSLAVRELVPDRRLGFGFPDHGALAQNQQYVAARDSLLSLMTPTHDTSSGTLWIDNSVRINDSASLEGVNLSPLREGPALLEPTLAALDGSRPFVINIGIADKYLYTVEGQSPTQYGYSHPDSPELPAQYLNASNEREKLYALTEQSLNLMAQTLADSGGALRFVSADGVVGLFTSDDYWNVDDDELEGIALWTLSEWDGRPPSWVYDGEDFYSLADALALLDAWFKGSSADIVSDVYGPWSVRQAQTPAVTVPLDDLRELLGADIVIDGRIQETYEAGGETLTATQLLYALSYLYVLDRNGASMAAIDIPATETAPATFGYLGTLGCTNCLDTAWSLKPARFQGLSGE